MLKNRIIPCLDVKNGRVVKGINFVELKDAGDPVEQAKIYSDGGADEICFLDITASNENRETIIDIVRKTAKECFVPLTVGGGVRTNQNITDLLLAGADRVIINSEGLKNIEFLKNVKNIFGSQFISISIETKKIDGKYICMMHHGRDISNFELIEWINELSKLQVGEIIINSIDHDGTNIGFDKDLINKIKIKMIEGPENI